MEIRQITEDKDNYLEMLLIADPQENMIRRYLDKSDMFVLEDAGEVLTIGVVEHMKNKRCELKKIWSLHRNIEDRDMGLIWSIIFLNITV